MKLEVHGLTHRTSFLDNGSRSNRRHRRKSQSQSRSQPTAQTSRTRQLTISRLVPSSSVRNQSQESGSRRRSQNSHTYMYLLFTAPLVSLPHPSIHPSIPYSAQPSQPYPMQVTRQRAPERVFPGGTGRASAISFNLLRGKVKLYESLV